MNQYMSSLLGYIIQYPDMVKSRLYAMAVGIWDTTACIVYHGMVRPYRIKVMNTRSNTVIDIETIDEHDELVHVQVDVEDIINQYEV